MCVLVMKNCKYSKPIFAKSRIVILGNFEYRRYQKSQHYTPVLKYISLCLLKAKSVGYKIMLQQGDCKNTFYKATLPENKVTVIRPPIGDLDFQDDEYWLLNKTLYGLLWSTHHWYNIIKGILLKMGLNTHHMTPAFFLVYFPTPPLLTPSLRFNLNSMLASMLTISCFIPQIQPRRPYSKHYSKNTDNSISWEMLTIS